MQRAQAAHQTAMLHEAAAARGTHACQAGQKAHSCKCRYNCRGSSTGSADASPPAARARPEPRPSHLLEPLEDARPAVLVEHLRRWPQDFVRVVQQQPAVPAEEEMPVRRAPTPALADKEASLPAAAVVMPRVVRPAQAPVGCGVRFWGRGEGGTMTTAPGVWGRTAACGTLRTCLPKPLPRCASASLHATVDLVRAHCAQTVVDRVKDDIVRHGKVRRRVAAGRGWAAVSSPFGMPDCFCRPAQAVQHVLVVTLKLAHAGKAPPAVALRVRGIPQLAGWPQAHSDLGDHGACRVVCATTQAACVRRGGGRG